MLTLQADPAAAAAAPAAIASQPVVNSPVPTAGGQGITAGVANPAVSPVIQGAAAGTSPADAQAQNGTGAADGQGNESRCGGEGQTECAGWLRILTMGYRFSPAWSVLHWFVIIAACMSVCYCWGQCCLGGSGRTI